MKVIWKYVIPPTGVRIVIGVDGAVVLCGVQNDQLCLWIEHTPTGKTQALEAKVYGTGHEIPQGGWHVGSALMPPFVWHVYLENPE